MLVTFGAWVLLKEHLDLSQLEICSDLLGWWQLSFIQGSSLLHGASSSSWFPGTKVHGTLQQLTAFENRTLVAMASTPFPPPGACSQIHGIPGQDYISDIWGGCFILSLCEGQGCSPVVGFIAFLSTPAIPAITHLELANPGIPECRTRPNPRIVPPAT